MNGLGVLKSLCNVVALGQFLFETVSPAEDKRAEWQGGLRFSRTAVRPSRGDVHHPERTKGTTLSAPHEPRQEQRVLPSQMLLSI